MFNIGFSEMLVLGALALLLIGPKQLPEIARTLGKFLNELKHSSSALTDEIKKTTSFENLTKPNSPQNSPKQQSSSEEKLNEPKES